MYVYLFLKDKVVKFTLPVDVFGSYKFYKLDSNDSELINIEAIENDWYLYSNDYVSIMNKGMRLDKVKLNPSNYYILQSNGVNYLVYVVSICDNSFQAYLPVENAEITIGKASSSNIRFNLSLINDVAFSLTYVTGGAIKFHNNNSLLYINNTISPVGDFYLRYGDSINLFGLRIVVLPKLILVNNPSNLLSVTGSLSKFNVKNAEDPKEVEFADRELYSYNDYFSRAPRIRRTIKKAEIKLDKPPSLPVSNKDQSLLLTLGPMVTMGIVSLLSSFSALKAVFDKSVPITQSVIPAATAVATLLSSILWPTLTKLYTSKTQDKNKKELIEKYDEYLKLKETEIINEYKLQKDILIENLISVEECLKIINIKKMSFWDKRLDQSDFLDVRIGFGNELFNGELKDPDDGFSIDENILKTKAHELAEKYKYITDVPVGYSLFKNQFTAVMGEERKVMFFVDNILLQLLTFYSYDILKIVVFTTEKNTSHWEYIKYLNHNFLNDRSVRLYADTQDDYKRLAEFMEFTVNQRKGVDDKNNVPVSPYYLILVDDYSLIKRFNFVKDITEANNNLGFSMLFLENKMSNLPSKCSNFINIGAKTSTVLKNAYEEQMVSSFFDEVNTNINMMNVAKAVSNVPIYFEEAANQLPESITFLEMEGVGRVRQLNIPDRWNTNDSTQTLRAEVGVDADGELMYLDLHEKFHGPHGLVAGMTGSGKSEFIITYILSMSINYSPDDVAFVLIDYKGGGLAYAFENKTNNIVLPHLAGTITNLDKSEMDRTLVSIDSEVKRRQMKFNEERDKLGESTMDIYKYQKYYKEGRISEPIPHLFIICDEFAELKSQQPDFMDNLISIARIGRSLGVHLILATQKPSGVVNDQIWSNSKFHVCLKVQDASDSNEMLKKPDAANLKQTGRFYLQVGYDEYFALGQSAWAGAKYFPVDKTIKKIDKSVSVINSSGSILKRIQSGSGSKGEAQGEQIAAIMKEIILVSENTHKRARKLWLPSIPEKIYLNDIISKYSLDTFSDLTAILGEYDAPEKQSQQVLIHEFLNCGNTCIYSSESSEYEMFLNSMIYSTMTNYGPENINFYALDFGNQFFRLYEKSNYFGGVVYYGDTQKYNNFIKFVSDELVERKKILSDYLGDYKMYLRKNSKPLPVLCFILNNFDMITEFDQTLYDKLPELLRDSDRYGVIFLLTASSSSSVSRRFGQHISTSYALRLKDASQYMEIFSSSKKIYPKELFGRGICFVDEGLHEFQMLSLVENSDDLHNYVSEFVEKTNSKSSVSAKRMPYVPDQVTVDFVKDYIKSMKKMPVGIAKKTVKLTYYNFTEFRINPILCNKVKFTKSFINSFVDEMLALQNTSLIVLDAADVLLSKKEKIRNYYNNEFVSVQQKINQTVNVVSDNAFVVLILGFDTFFNTVKSSNLFEEYINIISQHNNIVTVILETASKMKSYSYEGWYSSCVSDSNGLYIGMGVAEQNVVKVSNYSNEFSKNVSNSDLFVIKDSICTAVKPIEFEIEEVEDDD